MTSTGSDALRNAQNQTAMRERQARNRAEDAAAEKPKPASK